MAAILLAILAVSANGAVTVGQTFVPAEQFTGEGSLVQTDDPANRYAVPSNGVLTSWSFQAGSVVEPLHLKVLRNAGGNEFTTVGDSALEIPAINTLETWPTRIPVRVGDHLALHVTDTMEIHSNTGAGYFTHDLVGPSSDPPTGSTVDWGAPVESPQVDVAATLEPDADGDGFGDETQDGCPENADTQVPCPDVDPPETRITKGVGKRVGPKVRFKFVSDEPGSTFQCRLKGRGLDQSIKRFNRCSSPRKYRNLDPRRYKFSVRAVDRAGNVDREPATDRFKVVR